MARVIVRTLAAVAVAACSGAGAKPAAPTSTPDACRPAYTDYEVKWRVAMTEDLEAAHMEGMSDDIVAVEVATLPKRVELVKLRAGYKLIEAFIPEAAWPVAFAAADLAIERCGEGTSRPK